MPAFLLSTKGPFSLLLVALKADGDQFVVFL